MAARAQVGEEVLGHRGRELVQVRRDDQAIAGEIGRRMEHVHHLPRAAQGAIGEFVVRERIEAAVEALMVDRPAVVVAEQHRDRGVGLARVEEPSVPLQLGARANQSNA